MQDIEKILDTLIYDGKVERRLQAGGGVQEQLKLYRATQTLLPPVGLVKTPCGICPVSGVVPTTRVEMYGMAWSGILLDNASRHLQSMR